MSHNLGLNPGRYHSTDALIGWDIRLNRCIFFVSTRPTLIPSTSLLIRLYVSHIFQMVQTIKTAVIEGVGEIEGGSEVVVLWDRTNQIISIAKDVSVLTFFDYSDERISKVSTEKREIEQGAPVEGGLVKKPLSLLVREGRITAGISQQELASRVKEKKSLIKLIENGGIMPRQMPRGLCRRLEGALKLKELNIREWGTGFS